MSKKKYERITSPVGEAKYPYLNTPDTKFKEEGEYKVDLILDKAEEAKFLALLDDRAEKALDEAKIKLKEQNKINKLKDIGSYVPYEDIYDEQGNETGKVKVKFKSKAQFTKRDGTVVTLTPDLFDSKGKPIDREEVIIYSGSEIRCNFTPSSFYSPAGNQAGVSLRLNAVQVIKISKGNSAQASSYGFGAVEDGFSVEETDFGTSDTASDSGDSETTESGFDFEGADF